MSRATPPIRNATSSAAGDAERWFLINDDELRSLGVAIAEAAGPEAAAESMFRLGRRWGLQNAERLRNETSEMREQLDRGLARMATLGLGRVHVDHAQWSRSAGECSIRGRIEDPLRLASTNESREGFEGTVCALSSGYLSGLAAGLSGVDVVCTPFHCQSTCELCGGRFEIRASSSTPTASLEPASPAAGSARFFLGSLGRVMADSDLSLDDLLEETSDAVLLIDNDQMLRFWNHGAEEMFGWTREEVSGRRIGFLLPSDLIESDELGMLQGKLDRREPVRNFITRRVRKDGVELWVSLTRTLLHDSQGAVIGSTATLRDITEQKRVEDELAKARTLAVIGELAAKIAHEIKNPLAGIYGAVHVLARQLEPGDARRSVLESVQREIHRLDDTVLELLNFARPDGARTRPVALRNFIEDVAEPLRAQFAPQNIVIETDVDAGLIVPLDAKLGGQVLSNLIVNSAQALQGPGVVRVEALRREGEVEVRVLDNGPGFPPESLAKVFEPFFTTRSRGSGLGLAIVRKNVRSHGGHVVAENRPEGGACVRFTLPLAGSEATTNA